MSTVQLIRQRIPNFLSIIFEHDTEQIFLIIICCWYFRQNNPTSWKWSKFVKNWKRNSKFVLESKKRKLPLFSWTPCTKFKCDLKFHLLLNFLSQMLQLNSSIFWCINFMCTLSSTLLWNFFLHSLHSSKYSSGVDITS